tara:strand:- start:544 stop:747 length:204 start_codon:yes stop_codon:yes gene_type:complete
MNSTQLEYRKNAEMAVRAYAGSIGTSKEEEMSKLADDVLKKYFNSFPKKSLLAPKGNKLQITTNDAW